MSVPHPPHEPSYPQPISFRRPRWTAHNFTYSFEIAWSVCAMWLFGASHKLDASTARSVNKMTIRAEPRGIRQPASNRVSH